ncbi:MAG TPA: UDP-2,3-diacylglucosamine diphosphatase [Thauera sp.]|nr:UDP-2,3-diacylglucosamine diphosphatase [Thauera sp.]
MQRVRAIFISDVHLGTRACQADSLLAFLKTYESEYLYLLGDIIDFWAMNRSVQWAASHNTVVQKVLRRARHGCQVFFIPGNHDEALREYAGVAFGDIRVESEWIHETLDGRRYWLVHGDEYDQVTRHHRWVAVLGDVGYNTLVRINLLLSRARRLLRIPGYWSLAGYAKQKVKKAVSFIFDFEDAVAHAAQQRGVDGVVCGHIHWPADRRIGKVRYLNCGDWVDTCSAIVEHYDGRIEVVNWGVRGAAVEVEREELAPVAVPAPAPGDTVPVLLRSRTHKPERTYLTPDV